MLKYELGARLRKYRDRINMSQKDFAQLIGVSSSRVSNWEQGINRPDVDTLPKICEVLQVDPNELLDIRLTEDRLSAEERLIIEQYRKKQDVRKAVRILLGVEKLIE